MSSSLSIIQWFLALYTLFIWVEAAKPASRGPSSPLLVPSSVKSNETTPRNRTGSKCVHSHNCVACAGAERQESYCLSTGYKQEVKCGGSPRRTYFDTCAEESSLRSFIQFEVVCIISLVVGGMCMVRRRALVKSIQDRRLAHLIE